MKRITLLLLLVVLLCTACSRTSAGLDESLQKSAAGVMDQAPADPVQEPVTNLSDQAPAVPEAEDYVLLTLAAPLADGRTLTLEAIGRALNEYDYGVRTVQVYDGNTLLQTISVREIIKSEWGGGMTESFYDYTQCRSPETSIEVLDLNFDGNTDFGLYGWQPASDMPPYYYWQWDGERYQFAFGLQGVEAHPETGEISSEYKWGWGGANYQRDYYRPDKDGNLYLVRQERECWECDNVQNLDYDRGAAIETWVPRDGVVIRPNEQNEDDLVLIRRVIPVYEVNEYNRVSHFTEIWELKDGYLQLISREEYVYDHA